MPPKANVVVVVVVMVNAVATESKAEMNCRIDLNTCYPLPFSAGGILPPAELLFKKNSIIEEFVNTPPFFDEPKLYSFSAKLNIPNRIIYNREIESEVMIGYSGGTSKCKSRALWKVLGESLERYSLLLDKATFQYSSYNELIKTENSLNPESIAFSKNRRDFENNKMQNINWLKGKNLTNNKTSNIPAQLIAVPYWNDQDRVIWRAPITTGASAGQNINNVVYNGICEAVERDAFMVAWLKKLSLSRIEITDEFLRSNNSKLLKNTLDYIKNYKLNPEFYLIPNDTSIISVMCVLFDETKIGPKFTIGLDADLDLEKVILGSLEESLQLRPWCRQVFNMDKSIKKNIESLEDRVVLWQSKDAEEILKNWLNYSNSINAEEINIKKCSLNEIIDEVSNSGGNTYFVDTTQYLPKEIKDNYDLYTGKICIPEYQPLYLIERLADFCYNRLDNADLRLKTKANINGIETFPHPML